MISLHTKVVDRKNTELFIFMLTLKCQGERSENVTFGPYGHLPSCIAEDHDGDQKEGFGEERAGLYDSDGGDNGARILRIFLQPFYYPETPSHSAGHSIDRRTTGIPRCCVQEEAASKKFHCRQSSWQVGPDSRMRETTNSNVASSSI